MSTSRGLTHTETLESLSRHVDFPGGLLDATGYKVNTQRDEQVFESLRELFVEYLEAIDSIIVVWEPSRSSGISGLTVAAEFDSSSIEIKEFEEAIQIALSGDAREYSVAKKGEKNIGHFMTRSSWVCWSMNRESCRLICEHLTGETVRRDTLVSNRAFRESLSQIPATSDGVYFYLAPGMLSALGPLIVEGFPEFDWETLWMSLGITELKAMAGRLALTSVDAARNETEADTPSSDKVIANFEYVVTSAAPVGALISSLDELRSVDYDMARFDGTPAYFVQVRLDSKTLIEECNRRYLSRVIRDKEHQYWQLSERDRVNYGWIGSLLPHVNRVSPVGYKSMPAVLAVEVKDSAPIRDILLESLSKYPASDHFELSRTTEGDMDVWQLSDDSRREFESELRSEIREGIEKNNPDFRPELIDVVVQNHDAQIRTAVGRLGAQFVQVRDWLFLPLPGSLVEEKFGQETATHPDKIFIKLKDVVEQLREDSKERGEVVGVVAFWIRPSHWIPSEYPDNSVLRQLAEKTRKAMEPVRFRVSSILKKQGPSMKCTGVVHVLSQ